MNAIQYTVEKNMNKEKPTSLEQNVPFVDDSEVCLSCSA